MVVVGGDGFYHTFASATLADGDGFSTVRPNGALLPRCAPPAVVDRHPHALLRLAGLSTVEHLGLAASTLGLLTVVLVARGTSSSARPASGSWPPRSSPSPPTFWTYERNLNAEAITFPLIAATILLAYRYEARPTMLRLLALAATIGVLTLARSEQILIGAFVLLPLVIGTPDLRWPHKLGRLAASGLVAIVVISPWTIYNLDRFERPVILSAGGGNAMLAGACDTTLESCSARTTPTAT